MDVKGIRISDSIDNGISVSLFDILSEVLNGNIYQWSILFLDAGGNLGENVSIVDFCEEIRISEKGLIVSWDSLNSLVKNFSWINDIVLIGCTDEARIKKYKSDREMYESCDIVIVMFDSSYWEVFSKDHKFISRLSSKFKDLVFLETDFQEKMKGKYLE